MPLHFGNVCILFLCTWNMYEAWRTSNIVLMEYIGEYIPFKFQWNVDIPDTCIWHICQYALKIKGMINELLWENRESPKEV